MGYEEESRCLPLALNAPIVERCHHRLPSACCRHHEVLPTPVQLALGLKLLQDFGLEGVGGDVEVIVEEGGVGAFLVGNGFGETLAVALG